MWFYRSNRILPLVFDSVAVTNTTCAICLEALPNNGMGGLPCGHGFCSGCILTWLETNKHCPLCRTKLRFARKKNKTKH